MHYPIIALMRGSHGLSARSRGPESESGSEVGARRAPRLLVINIGICVIVMENTNII